MGPDDPFQLLKRLQPCKIQVLKSSSPPPAPGKVQTKTEVRLKDHCSQVQGEKGHPVWTGSRKQRSSKLWKCLKIRQTLSEVLMTIFT